MDRMRCRNARKKPETINTFAALRSEAEFWKRSLDHFVLGGGVRLRPAINTLSSPFSISSDVRFVQKLGDVRGKRILEVGCGLGDLSLLLGEMGADVVAVDIESSMLMYTRNRQQKLQIDVNPMLADALNLPFNSNSFDLVVAMRTVHHLLNLTKFFEETYRVLRSGGRAAFIEPLKKNPIVEVNRKILHPESRTELEHPLLMDDLRAAEDVFGNLDIETFYLVSPIAYVFERLIKTPGLFSAVFGALQKLERPFMNWGIFRAYCWQVIMTSESSRVDSGKKVNKI
jgi:SAM-dependent methyltransferase